MLSSHSTLINFIMKIFILGFLILFSISSSTAQTKRTKTQDFKYAFSYNTSVQHYDLEFYSIHEQAAPVQFLQIWTGNEYRDLSACNYSIDSVMDHQMIPITKKSSLNLIGKPPIRFKGAATYAPTFWDAVPKDSNLIFKNIF